MDQALMIFLRVGAGITGAALVWWTIASAVKTYVMPRGVNVKLTASVFRMVGAFFRFRTKRASTYSERDRVMAYFAPTAMVVMPLVFLSLVLLGYMGLFWAVGGGSLASVFKLSGSSLLTLGYESGASLAHKVLEFSEAMIGLVLVALLIAYLPTIYNAFSKRESLVAMLEAYAGTPPSAQEMLQRVHRIGDMPQLGDVWLRWQLWFAEIEESHTSLAPLSFFRSPQPDRSWVTAAGTILDTATLVLSTVDIPWDPQAAICIRNGYIALQRIAEFFEIEFEAKPSATTPISISHEEYAMLVAELAERGVPLKSDKEQAWRDFAGWRVNYDGVLLHLAALTMAPYAPWSSDRSPLKRPSSQ